MWAAVDAPAERFREGDVLRRIFAQCLAVLPRKVLEAWLIRENRATSSIREWNTAAGGASAKAAQPAESDVRRTRIPTEGGQHSDDGGQRVRAA